MEAREGLHFEFFTPKPPDRIQPISAGQVEAEKDRYGS
jgi:hypothetical protein